jgi:hypothetical protein
MAISPVRTHPFTAAIPQRYSMINTAISFNSNSITNDRPKAMDQHEARPNFGPIVNIHCVEVLDKA